MSVSPSQFWTTVDERVFSRDVVMKALYWLSARYVVEVKRGDSSGELSVGFRGIDSALTTEECAAVEARLRRDLIDFRTREIVEAETRTVRDLLVAKAFDSAAAG